MNKEGPGTGESIRRMTAAAGIMVRRIPQRVSLLLISYGLLKIPEKIVPPAIPAVMLDEIPASRSAAAKITDAAFPMSGVSIFPAVARSSTCFAFCGWKNVAAAIRIIALLMAHPMIMENRVSLNSYFNWRAITSSSSRFHWRL